ncbi:hypothetical protein LSH36_922g00002 [Paralvinella palmiformis]|uniref:Uncharacterized protein n=1 Tax=Paralvinella palmiformis TaxID=53620 RepID=A0AAD9IY63_9ANNE|nr:hypothetical protein LSH36_922g00002 [Paralvinella palmiformis]
MTTKALLAVVLLAVCVAMVTAMPHRGSPGHGGYDHGYGNPYDQHGGYPDGHYPGRYPGHYPGHYPGRYPGGGVHH